MDQQSAHIKLKTGTTGTTFFFGPWTTGTS